LSGTRGTSVRTVRYRAYAKLNFYLAVIERRPDGYHDIETIFQTVGLADDIALTPRDGEPTLSCGVADLEGPDNLALRAANLLRERHAPGRGVHIALTKRIPVAAGLAGGSADAAAVLVGLNRLWELGLPDDTLRSIALELGSDVPYLVSGGTMAATGRGEELRPLDALRETWFVLLHPPFEVSAARVYNHAALRKSREERIDGITMTFRNILEAMAQGALPDVLQNAMETAVFSEFPELAVFKQRLLDSGCAGALMSGSGPTLYGLCKDKAHAEAIARLFPELPKSVVPSVPMGVERI
jgi:4-diphosphocytidyl-2-C-methyl-D-erythritol kinase